MSFQAGSMQERMNLFLIDGSQVDSGRLFATEDTTGKHSKMDGFHNELFIIE